MGNNRKKGAYYEQLACKYLIEKGYEILDINYRNPCGEIDIIAQWEEYTIFIEVKYRKTVSYGYPSEAVTIRKQQRIIQTSYGYIQEKVLIQGSFRYDVIDILDTTIEHIENAFY